jgi:hypothetical protein
MIFDEIQMWRMWRMWRMGSVADSHLRSCYRDYRRIRPKPLARWESGGASPSRACSTDIGIDNEDTSPASHGPWIHSFEWIAPLSLLPGRDPSAAATCSLNRSSAPIAANSIMPPYTSAYDCVVLGSGGERGFIAGSLVVLEEVLPMLRVR